DHRTKRVVREEDVIGCYKYQAFGNTIVIDLRDDNTFMQRITSGGRTSARRTGTWKLLPNDRLVSLSQPLCWNGSSWQPEECTWMVVDDVKARRRFTIRGGAIADPDYYVEMARQWEPCPDE